LSTLAFITVVKRCQLLIARDSGTIMGL